MIDVPCLDERIAACFTVVASFKPGTLHQKSRNAGLKLNRKSVHSDSEQDDGEDKEGEEGGEVEVERGRLRRSERAAKQKHQG
eukprot:3873693-Pleurochrysis_carterae.AAC.1